MALNTRSGILNFDAVHAAANGQWPDILAGLGIDPAHLRNKHGACPACGGHDRFRFDDKEGRGTFICNNCGPGDGFGLLTLAHGWKASQALQEVARWLGLSQEQPLTPQARQTLKNEAKAKQAATAQADAEKRQQQAEEARQRWEAAAPAPDDHPYLRRKSVKAHGLRVCTWRKRVQGDAGKWSDCVIASALLVPMHNDDGAICGLQAIFPERVTALENRDKDFFGSKAGAFHLLGTPTKRLFIAEGYATAASVHEASGDAVAVAFDCGNLRAVAEALGRKYPGARLILAADDDRWSDGNPGLTKAQDAAEAVGGVLVRPVFVNVVGQPTDFNDLHEREGIEQVRAVIEEQLTAADREARKQTGKATRGTSSGKVVALPSAAKKTTLAPAQAAADGSPFYVTEQGLYRRPPDGGDPVRVGPPLHIVAKTRDEHGGNWGVLVRFRDPDHKDKEVILPDDLLIVEGGAEAAKLLAREGYKPAPIRSARQQLIEYLSGCRTPERATLVPKLGWHGDAFLLPRRIIGKPKERVLFTGGQQNHNAARESATLSEWQRDVSALCRGNHRLLFSVSCALAAPLLDLIGAESGGFHFYGDSSLGKTTLLRVAGSVWGDERFLHTWRATDNALELIAAAYSDCLLPLDELGQSDPRIVGEAVYMIGNGRGKARAADTGTSRRATASWRLLFLSSGEKTLAQHLSEAGRSMKAGMEVRMASVPAESTSGLGLFDTLHAHPNANRFAEQLREAVAHCHGTAGPAFVEALLQHGRDVVAASLPVVMTRFAAEHLPEGASGQAKRVANRFGLIAAAGEMATSWGVTGWAAGEATEAARVCLASWLAARGGVGSQEDREMRERVRLFFQLHGVNRFEVWERNNDDHAPVTVNRAGWRRCNPDGSWHYYVFTDVFKTDVCKGLNVDKVRAWLKSIGALVLTGDGRDPKLIYPGMAKGKKTRLCVVVNDRVWKDEGDVGPDEQDEAV